MSSNRINGICRLVLPYVYVHVQPNRIHSDLTIQLCQPIMPSFPALNRIIILLHSFWNRPLRTRLYNPPRQQNWSVSHHRHSPPLVLNEEDSRETNFLSRSLQFPTILIHLQSLTLPVKGMLATHHCEAFEVEVVAGSVAFWWRGKVLVARIFGFCRYRPGWGSLCDLGRMGDGWSKNWDVSEVSCDLGVCQITSSLRME